MTTNQRPIAWPGAPRRCGFRSPWLRGGLLASVLLGALGALRAEAQDLARGRQLFQLCGVCHGDTGQGNRLYSAPAIGGLPSWYVDAQLRKFQQGMRGSRAEDTTGLQMRPMARALTTEDDVKAVAAYVTTLRPPVLPATVKGDAGRGRAAFAVCQTCHGEKAAGNPAVNSPPLARQADWYLTAQIGKFRQGLRGVHPQDATGAQMRPMAMTLADDQAIADVVTYIRTLAQ